MHQNIVIRKHFCQHFSTFKKSTNLYHAWLFLFDLRQSEFPQGFDILS